MTFDVAAAVVVDFPLRGEWRAVNTPAERVPSHGTDYFGQRYAYDFVRFDAAGIRSQPGGITRQIFLGVPASDFFAWDQPVHCAFAGHVIGAGDGWPDRPVVRTLWELIRGTLSVPLAISQDYRPLTGNFVMIEGEPGVALYAHLRSGSICVREGAEIDAGAVIGRVGNSGNSTEPHLHFHLMDGRDPLTSHGVLVAFRGYRRFVSDAWVDVAHGVPARYERIRSVAD
jgi:murein DD-endopeptidase MepM/ murein hydrolase activator NlpD